jgi:CubicO group peptidase (beta-lactamase class C family)
MKTSIIAVLLLLVASICAGDEKKQEPPKPAQSIAELQAQLERILKDTKTPGVSVAIVRRDGAEWIAGLGKSDVAEDKPVTPETLFRIGSTSKTFASLSILKLANQGKLSITDPVRKLIPEVWFENQWEATHPVLVVDLLEHTTGWDDLDLREYAKQAPDSMDLREALDYDHHTRISRWRPGTRMAYCNSGPAVAAYVVEKVTGERFEDYVQQNFFDPIGMKTATYFEPKSGLTNLYHADGKTPYPYWHILYRPSGAINASAKDMASYVQFFLNRGMANGAQVMPPASIDRMESPTRTWAAQQGVKPGYGLSNYWSAEGGFIYHGHDGGVNGGLTDLAYMPEYGVGFFFSINSGSGDAFEKIGKAIRMYVTHNLKEPELPPVANLPAEATAYEGWYQLDSPRNAMFEFLDIAGITKLRAQGGKIFMSSIGERNGVFVPIEGTQFREIPKKEKDVPSPMVGLALLKPNQEGEFIQTGSGTTTIKKIPTWEATAKLSGMAWFLLSLVATLVYAPFWILGGLSKKRRRPAERAIRWWPLLAVLSLAVTIGAFLVSADDLVARLGNVTGYSLAVMLSSVIFAIACVAGLIALARASKTEVRRSVRIFSTVVVFGLLLGAAYLGVWGVIGIRTWR